jgi:hypothetical protein
MTEPVDHRAEAGQRIHEAEQVHVGDSTIEFALIAIAHDLHRIADALELAPDDQPGPGNVEADYTEDGQMIGETGVCT